MWSGRHTTLPHSDCGKGIALISPCAYFISRSCWKIDHADTFDDGVIKYSVSSDYQQYEGTFSALAGCNTVILFNLERSIVFENLVASVTEFVEHEPDIAQFLFNEDFLRAHRVKPDRFTLTFASRTLPSESWFCLDDLKALIDSFGLSPTKALEILLAKGKR